MAHVGALVDHQPLDLMEHGRVCHVVVAAVGAARRDDAVRRRLRLHGADLHRRGVGPEQHALARLVGAEVEGVVHLPRRVLRRDVERREVVEVVLDVGPFDDPEAHVGEDRDQLVQHLADGVNGALRLGAGRQGDIHALRREALVQGGAFQRSAAHVDRVGELALDLVEPDSGFLAGLDIEAAQALHRLAERRFLAERSDTGLLQCGQVAGRFDPGQHLLFQGVKVFQGPYSDGRPVTERRPISRSRRARSAPVPRRPRTPPAHGRRGPQEPCGRYPPWRAQGRA